MEKDELKEYKEKLEKCEQERDEYLNGWKRAKADFINYKKEEAERFARFAEMSSESMIIELISVLDSFDLGLTVLKDEASKKGLSLIKNQLDGILKRHGLERITAKIGEKFNPERMEALQEIDSSEPPGTVAEQVENGYMLGDRVLRPIRVHIAKNKVEASNK
ncbi:MAG: nucleotide exchange factor GrpE [Patescibacteria group bacterium]